MNNWKKNVTLFLSSQTLSLLGSSLVQYAIIWHITLSTQSGFMMTISIICGFLPTFFLSPFAGVLADRYNRKHLIILADAFIAVTTLLLAVLFWLGHGSIWLLFAASAARSIGSGIQNPAIGAFIPQMVPEDKLTRIHGINGSIQSLVMLVSPMLSGALLTMASIEVVFLIDVITAAVAIVLLALFLPVAPHARAQEESGVGYFEDFRAGVTYIRQHAFLKQLFSFCALFYILISPAAFLTPLQVTRSFGAEVWRLTAIEITFSIGMMLGGVIMAWWGGFTNRIHTMTLGCLVIGVCTFALGFVPAFALYLAVMLVTGFSIPLFNTPSTVLMQEKVSPDFLGRVFGVLGMISSSMMPIGMLIFGPLADLIRIEWLLISTGLLLFLQSFFLIFSPVLIEAGRPKPVTELRGEGR